MFNTNNTEMAQSKDKRKPLTLWVQNDRQQRWFVFGIAFAALMVNVDTYSVNVSLPTLAAYFHTSAAEMSWAVLAYNLAVTGGLLVAGRVGDRFGLRRVFLFGFGLYAMASLACGLAPQFVWLIAARVLQGLGGAILFGLSPAMVPRFLPPPVRGKAFGVLASAAAFGMTIGAPLGGLISGLLSWRGIFMVNVLLGSLALVIGRRILPDDSVLQTRERQQGMDALGGILSAVAALGVAFGLTQAPRWGWTAPAVIISMAGGVVAFIAFIQREKTVSNPLLDLSLFRIAAFVRGNVTSFLMYLFLAGTNFAMPFYLAKSRGLGSGETGFVMLAFALSFLVTGYLAGKAADRWKEQVIETGALALSAVVSAGFAFFLSWPGLWPVLIFLAGYGVSLAVFSPANNKTVMNMAPVGKEGMVAGAYRMIMRMGLVFGVCGSSLALSVTSHPGMATQTIGDLAGFRMAYGAGAIILFIAMFVAWQENKQTLKMTSAAGVKKTCVTNDKGDLL